MASRTLRTCGFLTIAISIPGRTYDYSWLMPISTPEQNDQRTGRRIPMGIV